MGRILSETELRKRKKRVGGILSCAGCGVGYEGHGNSRYCGVCRPLVVADVKRAGRAGGVEGAYAVWKAIVKRSGVGRANLGLSDFRSLVGVCVYCGQSAMGLVRCDLSGVWRPSNVVCCCGRCGKGKAGLSHAEYLGHLNRVVVHLSSS